MVYRTVAENPFPVYEKNAVSYRVYEGEKQTAEFAFHIQNMRGNEARRFWIDGIRLCEGFADASTMEEVLQFIQYKCSALGCPAMHVRLDSKNLFYMELYKKYGFYMMDEVESELPGGQISTVYVLKYPLPGSRDDILRGYILRSERKRAGAGPKKYSGGNRR